MERSRHVFRCPKCEYLDGKYERSSRLCVLSCGVPNPPNTGDRPRDCRRTRWNDRQHRYPRFVHDSSAFLQHSDLSVYWSGGRTSA
jgi:hypothetical protein